MTLRSPTDVPDGACVHQIDERGDVWHVEKGRGVACGRPCGLFCGDSDGYDPKRHRVCRDCRRVVLATIADRGTWWDDETLAAMGAAR